MKTISLPTGQIALCDDTDFEKISQFSWFANQPVPGYGCYAIAYGKKGAKTKHVKMHQVILGTVHGCIIDHKDGNGLNNQRSNLRHCTRSQNQMNQGPRSDSPTGFKGVTWIPKNRKFRVRIKVSGKSFPLGCFDNVRDAACAYNVAAVKYHGVFAYQNRI